MLDPVTALSVAGTVVQFVDFSARLISKGQVIQRKGSTVQNDELESVTNDLLDITQTLQVSLSRDPSLACSLSKDEQVRPQLVTTSLGVSNFAFAILILLTSGPR